MINVMPVVYACKNKNENIRRQSTSGGVFSVMATEVLNQGGAVFAVRFNEKFEPVYDFIESVLDIDRFRGSKYVQAIISSKMIFDLKSRLKNGQKVMIVGTPCTINGFARMLKQYRNQLLLVDFVCMGIASLKIWNEYLKQAFNQYDIQKITFKDKSTGWRNYSFSVQTDKGMITEHGKKNLYMQGYLNKLYLRPSCYNCACKGLNRDSDLTIADCWGIEDEYPDFDDDGGISSVFINSQKGKDYFEKFQEHIEFVQLSFDTATRKNHYYFDSAEKNYYRDDFFKVYSKNPSIDTMEKFRYKTRPIWIKVINKIVAKINHQ